MQLYSVQVNFLVPETLKHSRPIKLYNFGHLHQCKFLVYTCCTSFLSVCHRYNSELVPKSNLGNCWGSIFQGQMPSCNPNNSIKASTSSKWRTPNRALPYWRLDAKYPFPLPSSKPCGPKSSGAERPHLSLSARWILIDQEVSTNQVVVAARRRWHGGGPPLELTKPGARKTSIGSGTTWPFQRLASSPWCSGLNYWRMNQSKYFISLIT